MLTARALLSREVGGVSGPAGTVAGPPLEVSGAVEEFRPGGGFFRELAVRLGRPWLAGDAQGMERGLELGGPLHAGPLLECMGAFTRIRRGQQHPRGYRLDPWWLRADHRPASARVQLRALAEQAAAARKSGRPGGAGPAGALVVRRLYRDRHRRIHRCAYTALNEGTSRSAQQRPNRRGPA